MADLVNPTASSAHVSRMVFPPVVHVIWGIIQMIFFVLGSMVQVQTNEAWMLHSENPSTWIPNLNIFLQFPEFWNGHMSASQTIAFLFAWCVQVIMLTCKIGMVRAQIHVMKKYGAGANHAEVALVAKRRGAAWDILSGLIVAGNSIIDFMYSSFLGFLQAIVFSVVIFLTTYYAGTHGIQNITAGLSDMGKN